MQNKIVHARGMVCPKPLIMTKTALTELAPGQSMTVLIDNETSKQNVERFLRDNGAASSAIEKNGLYTLTVTKGESVLSHPDAELYREPSPKKSYTILFRNDKLGVGPDELCSILIKTFINTIKEVSPLPRALVFYTNGIHLAIEGSEVLAPLKELESRGIEILVCGTCLDYFNKKADLRVGKVSNMFTILETLSAAGHVIEP
ncbi:MAG: sulfurtransferase-like selenium metabolism protein YedF [Chitinivibrionales bacterium]